MDAVVNKLEYLDSIPLTDEEENTLQFQLEHSTELCCLCGKSHHHTEDTTKECCTCMETCIACKRTTPATYLNKNTQKSYETHIECFECDKGPLCITCLLDQKCSH